MFAKIKLPAGLDRRGTEYQSQARFWDADLVRWYLDRLQPIGGWAQIGTALTGTARAVHSWVDNSAAGRAALGTESNLYVLTTAGSLTDITPVSGWTDQGSTGDTLVTTGGDTLVTTGGDTLVTVASAGSSTWSLDNAGQLLVGVNDTHGTIFTWSPGDANAATLTNAPSADAIVVTNEGIIMALGSAGNPRQIAWCDRDDFTDWTAGFADLAGDLNVQARAGIQCGRNIRAGTLIWTSEDLHIARYVGLPNVYGVTPVANDCGVISRGAVAMVDDMAYWMGQNSFYVCNGGAYVDEVICTIHDDVFGAINETHAAKVRAMHNSEFNEIWWFYPKDSATENSHVAVYNYVEKHWTHHTLDRHCGIGRGNGFANPLMVDGPTVYQHETGTTMTGAGTPFARSGPVEIGDGSRVMHARRCIPDEKAAGDVELYFYTRSYPNASEVTHGPFDAANPINLRFAGRQAAMEFRQNTANDWRVGDYRLEGVPGGLR